MSEKFELGDIVAYKDRIKYNDNLFEVISNNFSLILTQVKEIYPAKNEVGYWVRSNAVKKVTLSALERALCGLE